MAESTYSNTRVAKNTVMLYFRMIVLLFIGLFTSRVMLKALGVENYGINSVIAGFLSMFGIITGSMSSAISRYITVELGKGDMARLKQVFSTAISVKYKSLVESVIYIVVEQSLYNQVTQGGCSDYSDLLSRRAPYLELFRCTRSISACF